VNDEARRREVNAGQVHLARVLEIIVAADERDATAVLFGKGQQQLGEGLPRGLGLLVVGIKPKHGQVGLQIGVKVLVRDFAKQRDLLLRNPLLQLLSGVRLREVEVEMGGRGDVGWWSIHNQGGV
jgi:hypothetical protein